MIRIFSLLAVFILFPIVCFPQEQDTAVKLKSYFGITGGFNSSKFRNDNYDCSYGTGLAFGIFSNSMLSRNVNFKNALLYSAKKSVTNVKYSRLENVYLDFIMTPQFRLFEDFYLQTGISYSKLISSKKVSSYAWKTKTGNTGFKSELNCIIGFQHKLEDNLNIECNYTIPAAKTHTKNLSVTLNYVLNNKEHKKETYRKTRIGKSKEQIRQLSSGTLLVRLKTSESTINALNTIGDAGKARRVKEQQDISNRKIISAFRKNFDFCKLAFFYNTNSEKILHREFGNIFLDDSLRIDTAIFIDTKNPVFIAEFGNIEQDSTKYFSQYVYDYNPGFMREKKYYTSSSEFDFIALLIRDENFVQLSDPFPYYVRALYVSMRKEPGEVIFLAPAVLPFFTWSYDKTVERMNNRLHHFYNRNL